MELIDQLVVSKSHFQKNNQTTIMVLLEIAKEDHLKKIKFIRQKNDEIIMKG